MSSEEANALQKKLDSMDSVIQPQSPSNSDLEEEVEGISREVDSVGTKRKKSLDVEAETESPVAQKRAKKSKRVIMPVRCYFALFP